MKIFQIVKDVIQTALLLAILYFAAPAKPAITQTPTPTLPPLAQTRLTEGWQIITPISSTIITPTVTPTITPAPTPTLLAIKTYEPVTIPDFITYRQFTKALVYPWARCGECQAPLMIGAYTTGEEAYTQTDIPLFWIPRGSEVIIVGYNYFNTVQMVWVAKLSDRDQLFYLSPMDIAPGSVGNDLPKITLNTK